MIAILDTAIDLNCPAFLREKIRIVDKLPGVPVTSVKHGNICAAVAVGSSNQATFPIGVAPGAELIMYRIAEGKSCSDDAILAALDDMKEKIESGTRIDVASISYDLGRDHAEEISRKMEALYTEKRVVFVAAAGNRGRHQSQASIPAIFDCVISVGACDKDGFESRFNSCGRIDVLAPGENIPAPFSPSNCESGTSFAAPAIGGLILLLKQCAYRIGPPASENIHDVRILRYIFTQHMTFMSASGKVFDPERFFLSKSNLLNEIIIEYFQSTKEQ